MKTSPEPDAAIKIACIPFHFECRISRMKNVCVRITNELERAALMEHSNRMARVFDK